MLLPSIRAQNNHVLEADTVVYAYEMVRQSHDIVCRGGCIGFYSCFQNILEDSQVLRPTVFGATPIFWRSLYAQYQHELQQRLDSDPSSSRSELRQAVLEQWICKKPLGNRLRALVSTGAPMDHEITRWLFRVFGCHVVDGYGTTETGGLASNGRVNASADVRLIDCLELGYMTSDLPHPRGEIIAHTPRITPGYYTPVLSISKTCREPEEDSQDFLMIGSRRFFRTGDVGEMVNGTIKIIDRRKSFFKLSQGVFVAPAHVEHALSQSPFVAQIFVHGNGSMSRVAAVVVPAQQLVYKVSKSLALSGILICS